MISLFSLNLHLLVRPCQRVLKTTVYHFDLVVLIALVLLLFVFLYALIGV